MGRRLRALQKRCNPSMARLKQRKTCYICKNRIAGGRSDTYYEYWPESVVGGKHYPVCLDCHQILGMQEWDRLRLIGENSFSDWVSEMLGRVIARRVRRTLKMVRQRCTFDTV